MTNLGGSWGAICLGLGFILWTLRDSFSFGIGDSDDFLYRNAHDTNVSNTVHIYWWGNSFHVLRHGSSIILYIYYNWLKFKIAKWMVLFLIVSKYQKWTLNHIFLILFSAYFLSVTLTDSVFIYVFATQIWKLLFTS